MLHPIWELQKIGLVTDPSGKLSDLEGLVDGVIL